MHAGLFFSTSYHMSPALACLSDEVFESSILGGNTGQVVCHRPVYVSKPLRDKKQQGRGAEHVHPTCQGEPMGESL